MQIVEIGKHYRLWRIDYHRTGNGDLPGKRECDPQQDDGESTKPDDQPHDGTHRLSPLICAQPSFPSASSLCASRAKRLAFRQKTIKFRDGSRLVPSCHRLSWFWPVSLRSCVPP